jgi:hypothetical protein
MFLHVFFMSVLLLVADVYMFCDVCLVGLSLTVGIFSTPSPIFKAPHHLFTLTALNSLIPLWVRFSWYYYTLHVPLFHPYVHTRFLFGAFLVPYLSVSEAASCERCLCLVDLYSCFFSLFSGKMVTSVRSGKSDMIPEELDSV